MNKFLFLALITTMALAQQPLSGGKTSFSPKNSGESEFMPSLNSNSGCALPSATNPAAIDPGVVGGPKEERNNPRSLVYPAPGCKPNFKANEK